MSDITCHDDDNDGPHPITLIRDGLPDAGDEPGWVVSCCEDHDPRARVWDTREDATADLGGEWWQEDPGVWMAILEDDDV